MIILAYDMVDNLYKVVNLIEVPESLMVVAIGNKDFNKVITTFTDNHKIDLIFKERDENIIDKVIKSSKKYNVPVKNRVYYKVLTKDRIKEVYNNLNNKEKGLLKGTKLIGIKEE